MHVLAVQPQQQHVFVTKQSAFSSGTCCIGADAAPAGTKIAPTAINVMSGKSYEQEFDLEQQRMAVSGCGHAAQLQQQQQQH